MGRVTEKFLARVRATVDEYTGTALPWVGVGVVAEVTKQSPREVRKALDLLTGREELRRRKDGRRFQWRTR